MAIKKQKVTKNINAAIKIETPVKKTVLLCANGFSTSDTHDSIARHEYFDKSFKEEYPTCDIVPVSLFLPSQKKTHSRKHFEKAYRAVIEEYISKGYDIRLLGYSFSCALTAKRANEYQDYVKKVILVAPVYDTIVNNRIPGYIEYAWKFHKLRKKYGKKVSGSICRETTVGRGKTLIAIFFSILFNRRYIRRLTIPTLIIHGTNDELSTEHAIKKVDRKIKGEHELFIYDKRTHAIRKNVRTNGIVFEDILHFAFNTPYLIEAESTIKRQEEKARKVALDEDGNPIPTFGEIFEELKPYTSEEAKYGEEEF